MTSERPETPTETEALEPFEIAVRGARVRYLDGGSGPPVVLLHGVGRDHAQWLPLARALSTERRVVAIDLPGFGASDPAGAWTFEALAEATLDVVAALGLGRVAVIGHSMGGAVALAAAADRPEFVERLVLVAPACYRPLRPLDERLLDAPVVGRTVFRKLLGPAVLRRQGGDAARASASAWAMLAASFAPSTIEARLPRVRAPVLVVWGREDPVSPWTHGTRLSRELAGARLEILDCGRFPESERAPAFEALVREFLDAPPGAPDVREAVGRPPNSRRGTLR